MAALVTTRQVTPRAASAEKIASGPANAERGAPASSHTEYPR